MVKTVDGIANRSIGDDQLLVSVKAQSSHVCTMTRDAKTILGLASLRTNANHQ